jgi:hypothetical protein
MLSDIQCPTIHFSTSYFYGYQRFKKENTTMTNAEDIEDDIEEIIAIESMRIRKTDGTIETVSGNNCAESLKEAIMAATAAEAVRLLESLQDEMLQLTTKVEQQEQQYTEQHEGLLENLDQYLHYMSEELKTHLTEDIEAGDEHLLMLVDSLADIQGVSAQDIVLRAAEKARGEAINPYADDGSKWSQGVPDGSAEKNRASIHGAGARQPATGNLGGGLKEHVEVDSRVQKYVDYLNGGYRGGLMNGVTKLRVVPKSELPQHLTEELRQDALDVISEVTDDMGEQAAAELMEDVGDISFDGNTEQLTENLQRKKAEKLQHDQRMAAFNRFEEARAKGYVCK